MRRLALLLALLLPACGGFQPTPPDEISIDPSFSVEQRAAIRDSIDAWCGVVGWCPEEVPWGEASRGNFIRDENFTVNREEENNVFGENDGENVYLNAHHPQFNNLDEFWIVSAHEGGHYGIGSHHTASGLMAWYHDPGQVNAEIDREAVRAWRDEQSKY